LEGAASDDESERLDAVADQAIATCGGDAREAVMALIVANHFLETELEKLRAWVSPGYPVAIHAPFSAASNQCCDSSTELAMDGSHLKILHLLREGADNQGAYMGRLVDSVYPEDNAEAQLDIDDGERRS
jgi:hypothetical protein